MFHRSSKVSLRDRIAEKGCVIGMQNFTGSPALVEVVGAVGFDFVSLDMEHTASSYREIEEMARAADLQGMVSVVRVSSNDPVKILKALDRGVDGILVPHIVRAADLRGAVDAALYPPQGSRGACSTVRASTYSAMGWQEYYTEANSSVTVIPLLEDADAIEHLEELFAVEGVDVYLIGVRDLAQTLGVAGADYRTDPLRSIGQDAIERANQAGKKIIVPVAPLLTPEYAAYLLELGFHGLSYGTDLSVFTSCCRNLLGSFEKSRAAVAGR